MHTEKKQADGNLVFRVFVCLFLGLVLFLFIRNNQLVTNLGHLRNPEALIMLVLLGFPFLLSLFHLIRGLRRRPDDLLNG